MEVCGSERVLGVCAVAAGTRAGPGCTPSPRGPDTGAPGGCGVPLLRCGPGGGHSRVRLWAVTAVE